jgi:hypothetical protein
MDIHLEFDTAFVVCVIVSIALALTTTSATPLLLLAAIVVRRHPKH